MRYIVQHIVSTLGSGAKFFELHGIVNNRFIGPARGHRKTFNSVISRSPPRRPSLSRANIFSLRQTLACLPPQQLSPWQAHRISWQQPHAAAAGRLASLLNSCRRLARHVTRSHAHQTDGRADGVVNH